MHCVPGSAESDLAVGTVLAGGAVASVAIQFWKLNQFKLKVKMRLKYKVF